MRYKVHNNENKPLTFDEWIESYRKCNGMSDHAEEVAKDAWEACKEQVLLVLGTPGCVPECMCDEYYNKIVDKIKKL